MSTASIGIRNSNTILPYTAATKQSKWFSIYSYITSSSGTISQGSVWARFQADSSGQWSIEINGYLNYSADVNFTGQTLSIAGIIFASNPAAQHVSGGFFSASSATQYGYFQAQADTDDLSFVVGSTTIRYVRLSGFATLKQEPTWTSLGTTAAAALEGVLPVDVYIAPATATSAGLVDTQAQSFAGVKTFSDGVKLDDAAGQSTLSYYKELDHVTTFTTTGTSPTPSASLTLKLTRVGRVVTMQVPTISVANSGSGAPGYITASTVIPDTGFRPSTSTATMVITNNNNAYTDGVFGFCSINVDGTINIYRVPSEAAFTAGAACGAYQFSISWVI